MAATPQGVSNQALEQILEQRLSTVLYRVVAAALTVAFEIREDGALARGESITDDMVKGEIRGIYNSFISEIDPQAMLARA